MCDRDKICRASFAPAKAVYQKDQFRFSLDSAPDMVSSTGVRLGPLSAGTLTLGSANTEMVWRDVEVDPCWSLDCSDPLAGARLNSSVAEWQVASGADGGVLMPDGKLYVRQPGLATFDLHVDSKIPGVVFGHSLATRINAYLKANKPRAQLVAMGLRKNGAPKLSTAAAFDVQLLSCGYDYGAPCAERAGRFASSTCRQLFAGLHGQPAGAGLRAPHPCPHSLVRSCGGPGVYHHARGHGLVPPRCCT
jgi:hypothetical protein